MRIRWEASQRIELLTAEALNVSASAMARMEQAGHLERVAPGVYIGVGHAQHPLIEAAAWACRHEQAVACLLTAAVHHELTDAFASGTWLFVPKGASPPRSQTQSVHVIQTAPRFIDPDHDAANGIDTIEVHGVALRITGPDRTTIDMWRYPRRVAREHALEALRRRRNAKDFRLPPFARLARRLGAWSRLEDIVQGLALR